MLQPTNKNAKRIQRKANYSRTPHIAVVKQPLNAEAFYTARELTDKTSPHYQFSQATLFRNLERLNPKYIGRKLLIKGASVIALIEGGSEE